MSRHPDNKRDFGALEAALDEELSNATPPDLRAAILRRATVADSQSSTTLRAAALLLLGGLAFAGVLWSTSGGGDTDSANNQSADDTADSLLEGTFSPHGPADLAQFREWLRDMPGTTYTVEAARVRASAQSPSVVIRRSLAITEILGVPRHLTLRDADDQQKIESALLTCAESTKPERAVPAEHILRLNHDKRVLYLGIYGLGCYPFASPNLRSDSPRYFVFSSHGPIHVDLPEAFAEWIQAEQLVETTSRLVIQEGLALGDAGLREMPRKKKSLRGIDLSPASLNLLSTFHDLRSLDLTHSPALHTPEAILALEPLRLKELFLDGRSLSEPAAANLGRLLTLQELGVWATDKGPYNVFLKPDILTRNDSPVVAGVGDSTVAQWTRLQKLRRLSIPRSAISDIGVQALGSLAALNTLMLIDCPNVRGASLPALGVESLQVSADTADLNSLRMMPRLEKLTVLRTTTADEVAAALSVPTLRTVYFGENPALEEEEVAALLPTLVQRPTRVKFWRCPGISRAACDAWQAAAPGCTFKIDG